MLIVHPQNPQERFIHQAVKVLQKGGVIVYPTDSGYALGCALDNKEGVDRIRQIRQLDKNHNFTLICKDLSELSQYAQIDTVIFRLLKAHTPGAYTFIMNATKEVPKRLQHPKRKTIGLRIPDNKITRALLDVLNAPILSVSLILPDQERLEKQVDLIIDGGHCDVEPSTVVDLTQFPPVIIRLGKGDPSVFSR